MFKKMYIIFIYLVGK